MAKNKNKKHVPPATMASPPGLVSPAAPATSSPQDTAATAQLPPPVAGSGGGNLLGAGTSLPHAAETSQAGGAAATVTLAPKSGQNSGMNSANSEKSRKFSKHVDGTSGKAWTSFFKDNRSATMGGILPKVLEGVKEDKILFDIKEFEDESHVPTSLVGFFSPKFPGIDIVNTVVNAWQHKCTVSRHMSSWCVFTFSSKEEALGILESGPFLVAGNTLHLRIMPKFFKFGREEQSTVSVWAQFHNLPLEFWKPRHLGKLCSFIGRPLHTDRLTVNRERISFARCLIEVTIGSDLPSCLPIELTDGTSWSQPVLYENIPVVCTFCKRLGHVAASCRGSSEPTLYVMKKSVVIPKVVKEKKMNPASAPKDVWVEVGNKDTATDATMAHPPPGTVTLDTIEEATGESSSKDEGSGDDCEDVRVPGDDYIEDPGDGVVQGGDELVMALQALPEAFSTYPPPSTTPILNGGGLALDPGCNSGYQIED